MSSAKRILGHQITVAILIFIVALSLRLIYINNTVVDTPIRADARSYVSIAINLLKFGVYSHTLSDTPTTDVFITPGYPIFLTAILAWQKTIEDTYYFVLHAQSIFMAATASIVFLLGYLFLPRWAAITAGLLAAFSPHLVTISGYVLTEAPFTFLLCLSLYLLALGIVKQNIWLLAVAAFVIGIDSLVRPVYLLMPVVIVAIIALNECFPLKTRMTYSALIMLIVAAVWSPWAIWKSDKEPSANNAVASFLLGSYPDLTYKDPKFKGIPYKEDETYKDNAKKLSLALKVVSERFQEKPGEYLYWYLIGKPMTYWTWSILVGHGGPFIYPIEKSIYFTNDFLSYTLTLYHAIHPIFVLLSLAALVLLVRSLHASKYNSEHDTVALLVVGCIAYFTVLHMVFAPLPRYSIPLHPLIYLAGLYAITKWIELKRNTPEPNAD